jgi:hypothetical protein
MSGFIEHNKKRAALAALFRDRRILAVLLLTAAVVLPLVFIAPPYFIRDAAGPAGAAGSWSRLLASFGAAKRGQSFSLSAVFGREPAATGPSSVDFVQGSAAEMGLVASPAHAAKTVRGILTPEDARRAGNGVALTDEDLAGERAAAGDLAYANRGFFAGSQGAFGRAGEEQRGAFDGFDVPAAGAGRVQGASPGRLPRAKGARLSAEMRASLNQSLLAGNAKSVTDLAQAHDRAGLSRAPDCTAANGCTAEFAAANLGAVYDGNSAGGAAAPSALSAPRMDGASQPAAAEARGKGAADETEQAGKDLQTCQRADADFTARESELARDLQKKLEQYRSLGCPPLWGSERSRRLCGGKAAEVAAACRLYNAMQCAHLEACPLTASDGCAQTDCDSLLPPASLRSLFSGMF